jgi:CheY-like chemotaxis protein
MDAVLVVEDEAIIRMNLTLHLEDEDFTVFEASNAAQAIAVLERHPEIRVVFTDLNMPGSMDGLKLAAYVRNRWPPIQIIMTSGKRRLEVTDLPDGSLFFAKPYELAQVTGAIAELLSQSTR